MQTTYKARPKRVLQYFRQKTMTEKWRFLLAAAGSIGTAITGVVLPFFYARIIDTIGLYAGGDKAMIVQALLWIFVGIIVIELLNFLSRRWIDFGIIKLELNVMKRIFQECFDYLHRHSYRFFSNAFGGAMVKKVNKLVYSYENVIDIFIFEFLRTWIGLPLIIVAVSLQNIYLGMMFLAWLIIYCIVQYFLYKRHLPFNIASNIEDSKVTWALADTITNHFNILTFASNKREAKLFGGVLNIRRGKAKAAWSNHVIIHIINTSLMLLFEFIILYAAIKFRGKDWITTGTIVILQMYIFRVFHQMFMIGNVFKRFYKAIGESSEMLDILDEKHEIQDVKNAKKMNVSKGEIIFENTGFRYVKNQPIFKWFDLDVKAGEKIALVGHSGAGKTTVVKLLMRFFDTQEGKILIDGQDVAKVTQESLRNHVSMVPQDPILFHRSLKENISYGKSDATMEEIIDVAKKARCHDFISTLNEGYNTLVGERWIKLSGGERQRVAIARSMLEDKKILVLDEATSSLDSESEKLIQEAMDVLMKGKTAIIIAHRLSTIMKMDRIVVMDQGAIIEEWTHENLLKKKGGVYKKLWDIQSGGFIE